MTPPLDGIRVLDLGIITAGAATSQVLADFGADVIKIESTTYTDPFRNWSQVLEGGTADLNESPVFQAVNRGKRSVAIDLKTDQGREVFLRMVEHSDIVVENFRRGVLDRLGIGFERLREANPRIVLLSLSSQGLTGPERGYISFGSTLEAIGGLMSLTGYDDQRPAWTTNNVNYPDQLVSIIAPGLALAGLRMRDSTGVGVHVDHAQREAVTSAMGEEIVRVSRGEPASPRASNRNTAFAPRGVYTTAGDDQWIAIDVRTDHQWRALCRVLDVPHLSDDDDFREAADRASSHGRLDRLLDAACSQWNKVTLAEALQEAGVPAAPVMSPGEVLSDVQLQELGFPQRVAETGPVQRGFVGRLSRTPATIRRQAPRLGEHTSEVLVDLLELDEGQLGQLRDARVIFCDPNDRDEPSTTLAMNA
jgi:crotonobetainyl-CoA:carnitine CoA-transferase CaiB-like acyl-CoA transferase